MKRQPIKQRLEKIIAVNMLITRVLWMILGIVILALGWNFLTESEKTMCEYLSTAENVLTATQDSLTNAQDVITTVDGTLTNTNKTISNLQEVLQKRAIPAAEFIDKGMATLDWATFWDGQDNYERLMPSFTQTNDELTAIDNAIMKVKSENIPKIPPVLSTYQTAIRSNLTLIHNTQEDLSNNFLRARWALVIVAVLIFFTQIPLLYVSLRELGSF